MRDYNKIILVITYYINNISISYINIIIKILIPTCFFENNKLINL